MAKDHDYKVDTKISMSLGIGISNACYKETVTTLGSLIGVEDQTRLDSMDKGEVENEIQEAANDWSHNYIDIGWEIEDEEGVVG